ncbi:MAG: outer membrane lipoprotein LolB, partial [Legionellales bacterium]|nr:outer membrane lipoprotein LolB [Legionellales bacterium]
MAQRKIYQFSIILSLVVNLFGCANRANILQENSKKISSSITHWEINGKISGYNKKENWRSSIVWQQSGNDFTVILIPSLTTKKIVLKQTKSLATFEMNQEISTEKFLDRILYKKVGWYIPFDSMQYWLKGLPDPKIPYEKISTTTGYKLIQNGWEINYKDFTTTSNYTLPRKIFVNNKDYNLRLII